MQEIVVNQSVVGACSRAMAWKCGQVVLA